jgi:small-conductance mechanosensitive channel
MNSRHLRVMILSATAFILLSCTVAGVACAGQPGPGATVPGAAGSGSLQGGTPESASPQTEAPVATPTALLEEIIMTRTPEPTATPGRLEQQVEELAETVGLARTTFLGLSVVNWINLAISLVYVLAGYLIGTWLIRYLLPRVVRRTRTEFDDRLLEAVGGEIRWLVVMLLLYLSTDRLTFVSVGLKTFLGDVYFVASLVLVVRAIFRLIDLADGLARQRTLEAGRQGEVEHLNVLLTRVARVVTGLLGLIVLLAHFGVNVTALSAALGLGGLSVTLAAQDTIADAIAGVIILVDRPFRIGDRIEIQEAGTWGDVVSIGLRTTRIRTRDNREIIVPNSTIGNSQVMNYSYPDPSYRSETHLSVGNDTDLETVRRLIVDTVRGAEGVLADRPIDALYIAMSSDGIDFRVRWWIETYAARRRNLDDVHTALQAALDEAVIPFASTTQSVKLQADLETVRRVASTFKARGGTRPMGEPDA